MKAEELKSTLKELVGGLYVRSEIDAPLEVRLLDNLLEVEKPEDIFAALGLPSAGSIDDVDIDEFFDPLTEIEDWMDEEEQQNAAGLARLKTLLESELTGLQVWIAGDRKKSVVLAGRPKSTGGGVLAVTTRAVET